MVLEVVQLWYMYLCVLYVCIQLLLLLIVYWFFFFKQKTAYEMRISDWSSDVCSSDLRAISRARLRQATGWPDESSSKASTGERPASSSSAATGPLPVAIGEWEASR